MTQGPDLLAALRRYWGYDSFLPLQERIVRSLIGGHDTCVVMPTGGGKSLCYQLPAAVASGQTVIVVSPLIALMQDQVAQLTQMGIPSALLNSSLTPEQQSEVMRKARKGEYRLLYLSPERIVRPDTAGWLQRIPISMFAIDEAHCISEWGHEFRPEYRQLSRLRAHFPDHPIAAFTASATRRVRHDIIEQLQLRAPHKYIASFHRPNLRYVVRECTESMQTSLLLAALREHAGASIIVYAPTIARVEETVDWLEGQDIPAVAYHGKMDTETRRRNQERFMSDEVRVLVGTLAFGLGINKAAVRAVIHLSLPKAIEQYYQEAGRAGRDGRPSDCILLWQKRDAGLLAFFIEQITDAAERARAWQRYYAIRDFAESKVCRHRQICTHFGETPKWTTCEACDVCSGEPEWLDAPRVGRSKRAASQPAAPPRPRKPESAAKRADHIAADVDPELREYLREWRRNTAKRQGIPAFAVMLDTSLEEVCRVRPRTLSELLNVYGFGERKVESYGPYVLEALENFRKGERASSAEQNTREMSRRAPAEETTLLLAQGRTFAEIAGIRGRQLSSVVSLVADLVERGDLDFQNSWVDAETQANIKAACARVGMARLNPIKQALPGIPIEDIRLVVAHLRWQWSQSQ